MRARLVVGALSAALVLTAATTLSAAAAMRRPARTAASAGPQCDLLATVGSTAATIQQTVQAQSGQQLPVDLAGTLGQLAAQAGCGGGGGSPAPGGATPAPLCDLLATVGSTAATIQQTVQAQSGQQLPVDLAGTLGQLAAQAGCGGGGGSPAPGGGTPAPLCDLLATVGSTAATIQQTVQAQSGQQLPVDLAATVGEVAAQAGCRTPAPGGPQGTTTSTTPPSTDGGSGSSSGSTGGSATGTGSPSEAAGGGAAVVDARVLGETTARGGQLPRTGESLPYEQLGAGALGLAGLVELVRRRVLSPR